jgi:hypothetical protein
LLKVLSGLREILKQQGIFYFYNIYQAIQRKQLLYNKQRSTNLTMA